jgi:alkylation response protein AidB-like acyl-CoA dehydrogenase
MVRPHSPRTNSGHRIEKAYLDEVTDPAIFRQMGATELLGATIPEEYGGLSANYVSYGLVAREAERIDSGYRSMMSVRLSLVMLSDICVCRETAQEVSAETRFGRLDRLLRSDRARGRRAVAMTSSPADMVPSRNMRFRVFLIMRHSNFTVSPMRTARTKCTSS